MGARARRLGQEHSVGRHRQVAHGGASGERPYQGGDRRAEKRLSAGQTDLVDFFQPDAVHDVVVVLTDPQYDGTDLSYQVEILDGEMPESGGEAALFIDIIGRPLSPVSLAGMNRRDRRADRRMR